MLKTVVSIKMMKIVIFLLPFGLFGCETISQLTTTSKTPKKDKTPVVSPSPTPIPVATPVPATPVPEPTIEPTALQPSLSRQNPTVYSTNQGCIDIIKKTEGVRYEAYVGPGGHWLIGYGHKQGVKKGMKISPQQAEAYLKEDLKAIEKQVAKMVTVDLTVNEFSAMVCLAYNIGWGNLRKSTVLKRVNAQRWSEAAEAFLMWRKVNGKVNAHLEKRRAEEKALFLSHS